MHIGNMNPNGLSRFPIENLTQKNTIKSQKSSILRLEI